jgi:hypothetical protein
MLISEKLVNLALYSFLKRRIKIEKFIKERGGRKMAVDVMETLEPEVMEMEQIIEEPVVVVDTVFVDTLWDQFERTLLRVRRLQEDQDEAYIKGVKEVIKFNKNYRGTLVNLYRETRKTNIEMVKGLMNNLTPKSKGESDIKPDRGELLIQVKEVYNVCEGMAYSPFKSMSEIIDGLEENIEKGAESYVSFARKRRQAWQELTDRYLKVARNTTYNLFERK